MHDVEQRRRTASGAGGAAADPARGSVGRQALRFLVVGGSNTLITWAIFVGLGLVIASPIAYAIAFAAGLIWTLLGTTRFVFRAQAGRPSLALYLLWYLAVFGVGQAIIHLLDPRDFWPLLGTSALVLAVTTPLNFLGGRVILTRGTPRVGAPDALQRRAPDAATGSRPCGDDGNGGAHDVHP